MQKRIFLESEANRWFERNKKALNSVEENDPVVSAIELLRLRPETILEVGCSNGYRLKLLKQKYNAGCFGIDPSEKAIKDGTAPGIQLLQGTADALPYGDKKFDLLIYGFCLYLCDRKDLYKIACEGDRVLRDKGFIVIYDFHPPMNLRNRYTHHESVYSYKMNYSKLFAWNPEYTIIYKKIFSHEKGNLFYSPNEAISVQILRKDLDNAYLTDPFK